MTREIDEWDYLSDEMQERIITLERKIVKLTSEQLDRAQEVGNKFLSWSPASGGPCPIDINDNIWFKKLCGLFENIAYLESELARLSGENAELREKTS